MPITNLLQRLVALFHSFIEGLLLEGDLATLLKIFLTHFFLCRGELSNVCVMTLLNILVGAFQDWVLLERGHSLLSLHTAEAGVRVIDAAGEVDTPIDQSVAIELTGAPVSEGDLVCRSQSQGGQ